MLTSSGSGAFPGATVPGRSDPDGAARRGRRHCVLRRDAAARRVFLNSGALAHTMSRIKRSLVNVAVAVSMAIAAACVSPAANPADACTALAALELIDLRIGAAERVPAEADLPAHCKVTGIIETEINFELLLPDDWNGRFLMGGGGGFVGTVQNQARTLYAYGGSPLQPRLRDSRNRHRTQRERHRGRLGAQSSRAAGELRPPRRPPDRGGPRSRSSRTTTPTGRPTTPSSSAARGAAGRR